MKTHFTINHHATVIATTIATNHDGFRLVWTAWKIMNIQSYKPSASQKSIKISIICPKGIGSAKLPPPGKQRVGHVKGRGNLTYRFGKKFFQ